MDEAGNAQTGSVDNSAPGSGAVLESSRRVTPRLPSGSYQRGRLQTIDRQIDERRLGRPRVRPTNRDFGGRSDGGLTRLELERRNLEFRLRAIEREREQADLRRRLDFRNRGSLYGR